LLHSLLVKLVVHAEAARWRATHFENSREKTIRRLADHDPDHAHLIKHILDHEGSRNSLSQTEIILNMVLFISAGSETTANTLTGWTYFVCRDPAILAKVTDEVRTAVASPEEIRWETVRELPYLNATLEEALRLFSPAPSNQPRVIPPGGAVVAGCRLPEGITVSVAPFAGVLAPENFADAEDFVLERWLSNDAADGRYASDKRAASQPFGTGPRSCIAKNLAWFELRLTLATLLWSFDLALDTSDTSQDLLRRWRKTDMDTFQTWMKPGLWLKMRDVRERKL
jgi:cytochrome P450